MWLYGSLRRENVLLVVALAVTVGLALGLRLYGLDWDRGYSYTPHPDERAILAKVGELSPPSLGELGVLLDAPNSPWNPRWFNYGSFPLYLLKGVQLVYSAWPGAELHDLRIAGRIISALADTGTVIVVYLLGSRLYGRREGLLASVLVALSVIHIQLSHFFAVDTILALCVVAALYFMYGVAREGRLRDSVLAGAFIGLGVATKVSVAPIYIAFLMAHLLFAFNVMGQAAGSDLRPGDRLRTVVKGLAVGAVASLLVVVVVQPYTFLDWDRFKENVYEQSEVVRRIRDYPFTRQYIDTAPYWYHIRQLATWGLGWPLGVVAWAGLLYASLRGMRPRPGLAYLALGWGLPVAVLLYSTSYLAILVASGISSVALVATLPFRSVQSRGAVLLLSWVVPYFLITGAFQVKFIRYLIPIAPLLVLLGSRMLLALWDSVRERRPALRPWLVGGLVLLVGSTGFYALSYMAVYGEPHTAVRISQWINQNASEGSIILREHWEEGVPGLFDYEIREMPLYDDDTPDKLRRLSEDLAEADYVMFFSNRLYGTIPRLPERYPFSSAYYRTLFSGELGYQLAHVEAAYPRLAGVSFLHDTLRRPNVPEPKAMSGSGPRGVVLNLGFADESFSVYDHPTGLVFENMARRDADAIRQIIQAAAPPEALTLGTPPDRTVGLLFTPEEAEAQRRGGTWSEIVRAGSWANRHPVLAWLLLVEGMALLVLPLTLIIFRPLADRGYLFSKALGLLAVGLLVWLLASLQWVPFTRGSIGLAMLLVVVLSTVALVRGHRQIVDFVRTRWPIILTGELLFLLAFLSFVALRMANPDLWHPFRGGEKPMELAYLNAVLRSSFMPPYDPWFGGGYLNYYYWGQFLVATMIKATGIDPRVAFNLAVPTFFAMTVAGAFSIVYSLAEGTRRSLGRDSDHGSRGRGAWRSPVVAGIGGVLFVTVLGNLDGAIQMGHGLWRVLVRNAPFGQFDFWLSSRMMPPDPPGHEITEFPFFTFLFADLHPHLMALPFTLLALGLSLALVLGAASHRGRHESVMGRLRQRGWSLGELARLAALGVVVGALRLINAWDFPTYLIVAAAAVTLAAYFRNGGLSVLVLLEAAAKSALVFLVGYVLFLPFHLSYEAFFTSLWPTTNQTVLWQFLAISGLFVFITGSFFVSESRSWLLTWWRALRRRVIALAWGPPDGRSAPLSAGEWYRVGVLRVSLMVLAAVVVGYVVSTTVSGMLGSTIPFLLVLEGLVVVAGLKFLRSSRADAPHLVFVALIVGVSMALAIGLDVYRVEQDIDRQNSVFKFYLQIWVLMALASAYLLWRLSYGRRVRWTGLAWRKKAWLAALAVLIAGASIYPLLGTQDRLRDRFNGRVLPMTLDGMAYMKEAVYGDGRGSIRLSSDYEGIIWLQENVEGSPIILEASTPSQYRYQWNGRISVYTGLPTVIGWQFHQEQQRWGYQWAIRERIRDVDRIYNTTDASEALLLMRKYGVEYVYVGRLESLYYPGEGLEKFDDALSEHLEKVYQNEEVKVYRLRGG
jgi:YYY domain-containing protein